MNRSVFALFLGVCLALSASLAFWFFPAFEKKDSVNGFDQLLADYRGYGLPLPPENAKLVRFESGGRYIL
jgi:hypothetical protein